MNENMTLTKLIRDAQVAPEGEQALIAQAAMEKTWKDGLLTFDLSKAGAVAIETAKNMRTIAPELEAVGYGPDAIDALEQAGHAALAADLIFRKQSLPEDAAAALVEEALGRRKALLDLVTWLEHGTLLPEGSVAELGVRLRRRGTVASDLAAMAGLCERNREKIEPKMYTTWDGIDWVNAHYTRLNAALVVGGPVDEDVKEAKAIRRRAASILVAAHRRGRQAVAYVRPDKAEADAIAPTFYLRGPRTKKEDAPATPSGSGKAADGSAADGNAEPVAKKDPPAAPVAKAPVA